MVEKRLVVDNLRLAYTGPFEVESFYAEVEDWIKKHGMEKEHKKKLEHVGQAGKKIEWHIEIWERKLEHEKIVIVLRALLKDLRQVSARKGKLNKKLHQGDVLVIFDAYDETDYEHKWHQKPVFAFLRKLFERYIWQYSSGRFDDELIGKTYDLHRTLRKFFQGYR